MASRETLGELPFKTISYSGLESYLKCPQFYKHKYIDRIPSEKATEDYFLYGGWAHEIVEHIILSSQSPLITLQENLSTWLEELNIVLSHEHREDLILCVKELATLLYRASARCKERSLQLRTKDGSPLKDPVNYPSTSFKKELLKADHYRTKSVVDGLAAKQNNEFQRISLTWTLAQAYSLGQSFIIPKWVHKTIGVEMSLGTSESEMVELAPGISLLGYIDWVVEIIGNQGGDPQLAIIDHKTSKSKPTALDVLWNPQLNIYAYGYSVVYGKLPQIIGINHMRTGELVAATLDKGVMSSVVTHFKDIVEQTYKNELPLKHRPTDYNSPCVKKDFKSGKVTSVCPFLDICWPQYNKMLSQSHSI